jgi:hypothetical protein
MGFIKSLSKGISNIGKGATKIVKKTFKETSDLVEDAWENDAVKAAAVIAGGYYAAPYLASAGSTVAGYASTAGAAISNFAQSTYEGWVDDAFVAGYSPDALGVAQYGAKSLYDAGVAANNVGGMLGVTGAGGGQQSLVPKRAVASGSSQADTAYGTFKSTAASLGINADVAAALGKVANTDIPSIRGAMNQVNRVAASGPNIPINGSLGSIGVRSETSVV